MKIFVLTFSESVNVTTTTTTTTTTESPNNTDINKNSSGIDRINSKLFYLQSYVDTSAAKDLSMKN